jgi:hypothetical protein
MLQFFTKVMLRVLSNKDRNFQLLEETQTGEKVFKKMEITAKCLEEKIGLMVNLSKTSMTDNF